MDGIVPRCILLLILIIAGGFFAGSETAFSYANTVRFRMLADDGDRAAKRVVRIIDNFDMTIVTLLIVINVVHIWASAVATSMFIDITGSTTVGSVTATVIITLAIFIFSETLPKNFAKTNCDSFSASASAVILGLFYVLFPLAWLLTEFGNIVKKIFKLYDNEPSVTEDEFSAMVEDAGEEEIFEPEETEIIKSAIEFGDTKVSEIMTPKNEVVAISVKEDEDEIKRILIEEKYSRFPVYRGSINNIVGVVRTSSALWKMINDKDGFNLREDMVKPMFAGPDDDVSEVFERMCKRRTHFAVIRDEDERTLGIVTMEDILEEIVGEIYDEDDPEEREVSDDE